MKKFANVLFIWLRSSVLGKALLKRTCKLIWTRSASRTACYAFEPIHGIACLHAFAQGDDPFVVAVAATNKLNVLDDIVVIKLNRDVPGTYSLWGIL